MNYGKAVEEVWKWREDFEEKLKKIPREKQVAFINETGHKACKRLGIKCRTAAPRVPIILHSSSQSFKMVSACRGSRYSESLNNRSQ